MPVSCRYSCLTFIIMLTKDVKTVGNHLFFFFNKTVGTLTNQMWKKQIKYRASNIKLVYIVTKKKSHKSQTNPLPHNLETPQYIPNGCWNRWFMKVVRERWQALKTMACNSQLLNIWIRLHWQLMINGNFDTTEKYPS